MPFLGNLYNQMQACFKTETRQGSPTPQNLSPLPKPHIY